MTWNHQFILGTFMLMASLDAVSADKSGVTSRESGEPPLNVEGTDHITFEMAPRHLEAVPASIYQQTSPAAAATEEEEGEYEDYIDEMDGDENSNEAVVNEITEWLLNQVEAYELAELDYRANADYLASLPPGAQLVYPVQVRSKARVHSLSTSDPKRKGTHFRHTSFDIRMGDVEYKLRLELNKDLLSKGLKQKRSLDTKTQLLEESSLESCFYQGYIRRMAESTVAVSTCNGISGIMRINNEDYIIRPLDLVNDANESAIFDQKWTRHPHVVYHSQPITNLTCGNEHGKWQHYRDLHSDEYLRKMKIAKASGNAHWTVESDDKHANIALVADHTLYRRMNSSLGATLRYLADVANIADMFSRAAKLRLTVVLLEVWNVHDIISVSPRVRETLINFLVYRQKSTPLLGVNTAQLVSGVGFEGRELGMALPASVCTDRAVALVHDPDSKNTIQVAVGVLHMLGHVIGAGHGEEGEAACSHGEQQGFIMSNTPIISYSNNTGIFSTCTQQELDNIFMGGLGTCLLSQPHEASYVQQCGNGVVERGEECDCRNAQQCEYEDPCCDHSTCLLKSWANCRQGDCCYNCTVLPRSFLCRAPLTDCDVPEFCDGLMGECPTNALFQDGQPCREGEGLCFHGNCHTYLDQCQDIWGPDSKPADHKCFETFNPAGRFNGHCGLNFTVDQYLKCSPEHVKCGLLHCAGGDDTPKYGHEDAFSVINMVSGGTEYQCKNLNGYTASLQLPQIGMVEDGTPCAPNSMCLASHCIPISSVITRQCPRGINNLTCSGTGVCSSDVKCVCFMDYEGHDCSKVKVVVTQAPTSSSTTHLPLTTMATNTTHILLTSTTEVQLPVVNQRNVSIQWLVIVLASVAGGTLLLFVCCFICYRRKSPVKHSKKKHQKGMFGSVASFSSATSKRPDGSDIIEPANRIISFGNMPSYRADKIKKFQKTLAGVQSGTGSESEQSRGDRSSTEVKSPHTLPMVKSQPERGILKKYPRSADDLQSSSELEPLRGSPAGMPSSPRMGTRSRANNRTPLRGGAPVEPGASGSPAYKSPLDRNSFQFIDEPVQCDEVVGGDDDVSCCSCESCNGENCSECGEENKKLLSPNAEPGPTCQSSEGSGDSLQGTRNKIVKLRNINDLLKQIDEQFNTVLLQSAETDLSPTQSAGSETEADRNFPRDSFYKQSDIEEGYSPPHRSPILSPNPNRYSCGPSSPEPLPSPNDMFTPINKDGTRSKAKQSPRSSTEEAGASSEQGNFSPSASLKGPLAKAKPAEISSSKVADTTKDRSNSLNSQHATSSANSNSLPASGDLSQPVTAVPYRGAKTPPQSELSNSPKGSLKALNSLSTTGGAKKKDPPAASPGYQKPSSPANSLTKSPSTPSKGIFKGSPRLSKFAHPIFDGYPFKKRGSPSNDGQSVSEGYHSDRQDLDDAIIIREIPLSKPSELRFSPDPTGAYTRCPGSPGSPDDIDV